MEIESKGYLQAPRKMWATSNKKNSQKNYRFHHDHGHDIEECIQLKDEIEVLIRWGLLGQFVVKQQEQEELTSTHSPPEEMTDNRPTIGVINNISRGSVKPIDAPPESDQVKDIWAKRLWTGDVISIFDNDLKGVRTPPDDVIVISLTISNIDAKRILVDNTSSADILFYDAF